jgi:hypothetical protein
VDVRAPRDIPFHVVRYLTLPKVKYLLPLSYSTTYLAVLELAPLLGGTARRRTETLEVGRQERLCNIEFLGFCCFSFAAVEESSSAPFCLEEGMLVNPPPLF